MGRELARGDALPMTGLLDACESGRRGPLYLAHFFFRTIRRKASCFRSRRTRGIGQGIGSRLSEIRQEHQDVAHRNHADQFSILSYAKMSDMFLGHQIAGI